MGGILTAGAGADRSLLALSLVVRLKHRFGSVRAIARLFAIALSVVACTASGSEDAVPPGDGTTDDATPRVITFLEQRVQQDPDDVFAQNRLANLYLERLRETGSYEWLRLARAAAQQSLTAVPAEQNTAGQATMVRVEQESHHFAAARDAALALVKIEPNKSRSFALLGDALLEYGDLAEAAEAYEQMQRCGSDPIKIETRVARLALARGAIDEARDHFEKALAFALKSSAPQTEAVLWCRIQLGQLAFNTGDWDTAEKHYQSALELKPGDPRAMEHLAELRAAQEKYEEAISLFQRAIARTPRPEYWQALGDIYAAMGKSAEAVPWHERARDAFLENARAGNDHYFHHLAGFYSDAEEKPAEGLKWARKDLTLRHSAAAHDALAWALHRGGDYPPAADAAQAALTCGTKDAHILFHAGMIFLAAGEVMRGKETLAEAARVNPRHNSFHVHR